jgi:hypothetical protein
MGSECNIQKVNSIAKPQALFYATLAPSKKFDAASAMDPTKLYNKSKCLNRT